MILDRQIDTLQYHYANPANHEWIDRSIARTGRALSNLFDTIRTPPESWNDYFRLLSHGTFLEQRIKAPALFNDSQEWRGRKALTNGIYGMNAHIIKVALAFHDAPNTSDIERMELRGAIQEQTASALLNYRQTPSDIALPARLRDDLWHETDIDYWRIPGRAAAERIGIQVKSSVPPDAPLITRSGSVIVSAKDFGNSHTYDNMSLMTARLIAADLSDGGLEPILKQYLEDQQSAFVTLLNDRIANVYADAN